MKRSITGLIVIFALSLLVAPLVTAQPQAKAPRIGWLASGFPPSEADRQ
jgi:hypothetical protein